MILLVGSQWHGPGAAGVRGGGPGGEEGFGTSSQDFWPKRKT